MRSKDRLQTATNRLFTMPSNTTASDRDRILELLASNIESLNERIQRQPDDLDPEDEQLQLDRLRTLAHLTSQYRLLARDLDIDEMESNLELLEKVADNGGAFDD